VLILVTSSSNFLPHLAAAFSGDWRRWDDLFDVAANGGGGNK
jgi:hypothetical protein